MVSGLNSGAILMDDLDSYHELQPSATSILPTGQRPINDGVTRSVEIVFDSEADGFLDEATQVWVVCLRDLHDVYSPVEDYRSIEAALFRLDQADHLIGHNIIGYDLPLFKKLYGWEPKPHVKITDTLIRSRLFRPDRVLPPGCPGNVGPHSLAAWGYRVGRGKPEHNDWSQWSPEMTHRCSEDVEINILTHWELVIEEHEDSRIRWNQSLETEHAIARIIVTQEQHGCPLDLALVWRTRMELRDLILETDKEVVPLIPEVPLAKSKQPTWPSRQYKKDGTPTQQALKYYGDDFGLQKEYRTDTIVRTAPINLNSEKQVKEYLMSIGWVPTEWNYKKGKDGKPIRDMMGNRIKTSPKLTLESLESCKFPDEHADMGAKICTRLMMAHRKSMLTGWLRDVRADGLIAAEANPLGTPTGRMTHRKVVNVPRKSSPWGDKLRACFTSLPGYTRVGVDLKSCQIYGLSHYMQDEEYRYQVTEGDHHQFAADLAGLADRDAGKKFNYSILFGASDDKLAADLGISKQQAAAARAAYFRGLPKLDALLKKLEREWKQYGYILGLDGRAIFVRARHMLLVYLLQALESVVIKEFTVAVYENAKALGLDFMLVTTMHDECQWLVKDEHVEVFQNICHASIRRINEKYNLWHPQEIDVNLGTTWADCH